MSVIVGQAIYSKTGLQRAEEKSIFGDGSDGALNIASGQTVTLPVAASHLSLIEKNYSSINIASGGILKCDLPNNGLVLRCKGDCIINGTIDQSNKSGIPGTVVQFDYPTYTCGNGGQGGRAYYNSGRAAAMSGHNGGGGWGSGGTGGSYCGDDSESGYYGYGGSTGGPTNNITPAVFISELWNSRYGGGGTGYNGKSGGTSAGAAGTSNTNYKYPAGGGAGNYGGGVVMIYAGGNITISSSGIINCSGGRGGDGGTGCNRYGGQSAGSGGGGGGGAFYCVYNGAYSNTGTVNVNAGLAGAVSTGGSAGSAGAIGSIVTKKYDGSMTK